MLTKFFMRILFISTVLGVLIQGPAIEASLRPGHTPLSYGGNREYSPNGLYYLEVAYDSVYNRYFLRMSINQGCGNYPLWDSWNDGRRTVTCLSDLGTHTDQSADATYQASAELQSDGNFVLYTSPGGTAVWSTNTSGYTNNPSLDVQNDTNLVLYENGTAIWSIF